VPRPAPSAIVIKKACAVSASPGACYTIASIPLISLGMRNTYDPQGMQRWLAYFLIAAGWVFVTTIAAGVLRVLRCQ
jgi:hypothetical protein